MKKRKENIASEMLKELQVNAKCIAKEREVYFKVMQKNLQATTKITKSHCDSWRLLRNFSPSIKT